MRKNELALAESIGNLPVGKVVALRPCDVAGSTARPESFEHRPRRGGHRPPAPRGKGDRFIFRLIYFPANRYKSVPFVAICCLKNYPSIMVRAQIKNGGAWGRLFVLAAIMGVMTMPNVYLRDGGANAKDLQSFPGNLRRKLIALHWSGVVFIVILLGLFTVSALGLV